MPFASQAACSRELAAENPEPDATPTAAPEHPARAGELGQEVFLNHHLPTDRDVVGKIDDPETAGAKRSLDDEFVGLGAAVRTT